MPGQVLPADRAGRAGGGVFAPVRCGQPVQQPGRAFYGRGMPADQAPPGVHADRHLLALHALHHRQLLSAFLHGGHRSWRDRRRVWPAVATGLVIIALLLAAFSVLAAFTQQQRLDATTSSAQLLLP